MLTLVVGEGEGTFDSLRTPPDRNRSRIRVTKAPEVPARAVVQVRGEVRAQAVVQVRAGAAARVAGSVRVVARGYVRGLETSCGA